MDVRALKDDAAEQFRKGRFARAAERYGELVKAEPRDPQHLIKLGDSLRRDNKRELAITAYCKAVDMYAQQGVVIKAIAACKLVLELDPEQKAVQEALASLIERRYVRRDRVEPVPTVPVQPPAPYVHDAIEFPQDGDDALELDTGSGESLELDYSRSGFGVADPTGGGLPPLTRHRDPEFLEIIEEDRQPPVLVPTRQDFDAIEIDFDDLPDAEVEKQADASVESVSESLLVHGDEALAPTDDAIGPAVFLDVEEKLERPEQPTTSTMIDILSDSLLIEGELEDGEEVELLSITTGEPSIMSEPSVIVDLDPVVALPTDTSLAFKRETKDAQATGQASEADAVVAASSTQAVAEPLLVDNERTESTPAATDVEQQRVPLFSELPQGAFLELLDKVVFRRVDEGEVILREGERGRSIFVLASGRARVVKGYETSEPIELAVLEDGSFFGEMALLNGATRLASIVASENCETLELTEDVLSDLMRRHPSVTHSLKKFYRQRLLSNVMTMSPLFKAFDTNDRRMLVEKFKLREMKPGEAIIREGGTPDGLYLVMHGACLVTKVVDGDRTVPLAVLREGDVFGEMSLLSRQPSSASVSATRRTLVLRLPKAVFDELMFTHPAVLEVVSELTDERTRLYEQIVSGEVEVPEEVRALL